MVLHTKALTLGYAVLELVEYGVADGDEFEALDDEDELNEYLCTRRQALALSAFRRSKAFQLLIGAENDVRALEDIIVIAQAACVALHKVQEFLTDDALASEEEETEE